MNDLIARLEAAECGSRELDWEIAQAFGWKQDKLPNGRVTCVVDPQGKGCGGVPWFSTSIDAALTLLPQEAGITLDRHWMMSKEGACWTAWIMVEAGQEHECEYARSAALAICAVALRARQAEVRDA